MYQSIALAVRVRLWLALFGIVTLAIVAAGCGTTGRDVETDIGRQSLVTKQTSPHETELSLRIDTILSEFCTDDRPGIAVIACRDSRPVFRKAYGLADLEHGIPLEPDMVFRIASVTKQFTAMLIMQLVEAGAISLDDELTAYIPEFPTQGNTVTIRHLLTHTSGIGNYHQLDDFQEKLYRDFTPDQMIERFTALSFDFAPGEQYRYCNTGYFLLGAIIERVTGKSYSENLREKIFDPLGMNSAQVARNDTLIPRRVRGYWCEDGVHCNIAQSNLTQAFSTGSLAMSVDDLATWDEALYTDALLSDAGRRQMWTPGVLDDGSSTQYGFGWELTEYLGHDLISHDGSIDGFTSAVIRVPDEHIYIAVLNNVYPSDPGPVFCAKRILGVMLGVPEKQVMPMSTEHLQPYVAMYTTENGRLNFHVTFEEDSLFMRIGSRKFEIVPETTTNFFMPRAFHTVDFELDEQDVPTHFVFTTDTGRVFEADRNE